MQILEILKKYQDIEIELLLAHVLNKPKEFLYLEPIHKLSANQFVRLQKLITRRQKGEPIAYILGYKDFLGLKFKVNKPTLIPRPETELLVERIQNRVLSIGVRNVKILDVGTGSGIIAISLAKQLKVLNYKYQITATDISKKALVVAKTNAKKHKEKIKFIQSNLLKNIKEDFDIIVANLPYLPRLDSRVKEGGWTEWEINTSSATVGLKFEPQNALFTEEKGLKLIRKLLEQIAGKKNKPGLIYLEFDPRQKQELQKLIKKTLPEFKYKFYKDYSKFWRFVEIIK